VDTDSWKILGIITAAFTALFGVLIALGIYFIERPSCLSKWEDYNPTWGIYEGCRIVINGRRTAVESLRQLESVQEYNNDPGE